MQSKIKYVRVICGETVLNIMLKRYVKYLRENEECCIVASYLYCLEISQVLKTFLLSLILEWVEKNSVKNTTKNMILHVYKPLDDLCPKSFHG